MAIDKYASIRPYLGATPGWMPASDAIRTSSYDAFESMYWNDPATFRVIQRGSDASPIYLPTPRLLVDTVNRFFARGFDYVVDPTVGVASDQQAVSQAFRSLFRREDFFKKFRNHKKYGVIRGDSFWHIVADPLKPAGRRISLYNLHPGKVFAIRDIDDVTKVVGYYIVEQALFQGRARVLRQMYLKTDAGISSSLGYFEPEAWDDRPDADGKVTPAKLVQWVINPKVLPPRIDALPIYKYGNAENDDDFWGNSELRGFERVFAAIDQAASDAELTLALDGIGVYATTSGPPQDAAGNVTAWTLGPGRVVEHSPESSFGRVSGIASLQPFSEQVTLLSSALKQAMATPDVAIGTVDVQVAQSGIALQLQMGPLLGKNEEKTDDLLGEHDHMFYDIQHGWLPTYEGIDFPDVDVSPVVGDPLPVDRDARVKELLSLVTSTPAVISVQYAQAELTKLGYEFPAEMLGQIVQEQALMNALNPDQFAQRLDDILNPPPAAQQNGGQLNGAPVA